MNANAELERPNDSLISPTLTIVSGDNGGSVSVSGESRIANTGYRKIRNGTNNAEPLIPTVLTIVAPSRNTGNSHQNSSQ
jgi:hypothetical protein